MSSNSGPESVAVKTNFIAEAKTQKVNNIGSDVQGTGTLKMKGFSQYSSSPFQTTILGRVLVCAVPSVWNTFHSPCLTHSIHPSDLS